MKIRQYLAIALVAVMALTIVSSAGVVTAQVISTTATLYVNPTTATVGEPYSIYAVVRDATGNTVTTGDVEFWCVLPGDTAATLLGTVPDGNGDGQFVPSGGGYTYTEAGEYQFYARFVPDAGSGLTESVSSPPITATVTGPTITKDTVLQDLATLRSDVNALPSNAFVPFTKMMLLGAINVATWQVKAGRYSDAANTLAFVLGRMDGGKAGGSPDWNDWMRSSAAQAQLYPQVAGLIADLQTLQVAG